MKIPNEVKAYLAKIGAKGGKAATKAKTEAARTNGSAPVKPGSKPRGRPKKPKPTGKK